MASFLEILALLEDRRSGEGWAKWTLFAEEREGLGPMEHDWLFLHRRGWGLQVKVLQLSGWRGEEKQRLFSICVWISSIEGGETFGDDNVTCATYLSILACLWMLSMSPTARPTCVQISNSHCHSTWKDHFCVDETAVQNYTIPILPY